MGFGPNQAKYRKPAVLSMDLPDLLYVHRIGSADLRWSDFIEDWARERLKLRNSGQIKNSFFVRHCEVERFRVQTSSNGGRDNISMVVGLSVSPGSEARV